MKSRVDDILKRRDLGLAVRRLINDLYNELEKSESKFDDLKSDQENTMKFIMDEKCSLDEKHCTCVPFLKFEITKLKIERENLQYTIRSLRERINKDGS